MDTMRIVVFAYLLLILNPVIQASAPMPAYGEEGGTEALPENPSYRSNCSLCHFLYQPWLLPEGSWEEMLGSRDHFGRPLTIDERTRGEILKYLRDNSLENTGVRNGLTGRDGALFKSLEGKLPKRITEIPHMAARHRFIKKEVFERPSVGGPSNCWACHRRGEMGDYTTDVRVPK